MKTLTKIVSLALLAGILSVGAVGCTTWGDKSNVNNANSQENVQEILSQDPKEVYQKVYDKMLSVGSYAVKVEGSINGEEPVATFSGESNIIGIGKENCQVVDELDIAFSDASLSSVKNKTYFKDGVQYVNTVSDDGEKKIKRNLTEDEKGKYKSTILPTEDMSDIKLEKDENNNAVIVASSKKSMSRYTSINKSVTGCTVRITIKGDYSIQSIESETKCDFQGQSFAIKEKATYSYGSVKVVFPPFNDYVEAE